METENNELKYRLQVEADHKKKVVELEEEVASLHLLVSRNAEYIFDLEQKIAASRLEAEENSEAIKRDMLGRLEEERRGST